MRKTIYILLILTGISCSDDFLTPKNFTENSENYFNTPDEYQKSLLGVYSMLYPTYLNVMIGEIASDNSLAGGESATDVVGIQEIDNMTHNPTNEQLRSIWQWMYAGINRANYIVEFQDKIDFTGKNEVLAQTRFLRAYFYFELVKFFGDVPLKTDRRFQFGDESIIKRSPKTEVYKAIEEDLSYAVSNLPDSQSDVGRATKTAAQALLGKVYLYQDKFTEAATMLDNVIDSGKYQLVTNFNDIFEQDGENGTESVFEIQNTDNTNGDGADFGCLQCSPGNIAAGFNGVRNFVDTSDTFDSGFSFNVLTKELADAFDNADQRKNTTILDIEAHVVANPGSTFAKGFEHTGYYNRKYIARKGDKNIGDQNLTNPNNYRAIRYADVLLMAAEAHSRGAANDTKAQNYLNQVRTRAGLSNVTQTGTSLIEAIWNERRFELAGEGHRFFDLVRTGEASKYIVATKDQGAFIIGKHEVFPIPSIEIELAGNQWEQNPNY